MKDNNMNDINYLKDMLRKKEESIKCWKNKLEEERAKVRQLEYIKDKFNKITLKYTLLEKKMETNKVIVDALIKQNKLIFRPAFNSATNQFKREEDCITTIYTVISDFENAFVYQKLFEMHLCDCIIDKLYGLRKLDYISDNRLEELFNETRNFMSYIVIKEVKNERLQLKELKEALYIYINKWVKELSKNI